MANLNKYGEIDPEGVCPECGRPMKQEWIACPNCGHKQAQTQHKRSTGGAQSGNRQASKSRNFRHASLEEISAWAYSSKLLNYSKSEAARWALQHDTFFGEHDFDLFCRLAAWAYTSDGLNYGRDEAANWALQHTGFFEVHDFSIFCQLAAWAYTSDGLNCGRDKAANWAQQAVTKYAEGVSLDRIKVEAIAQRGCFISTAAIRCLGLEDDCRELNLLRVFRDSYMLATPQRRREVESYYRIAPQIVRHIESCADSDSILRELWFSHIQPAVAAIERRSPRKAHERYAAMMREVSRRYLSPFRAKHHHE